MPPISRDALSHPPSESFAILFSSSSSFLLSIADQIFALSSFLAYGRTNTAPLSSLFLFRTRSIDDQKRGGEGKWEVVLIKILEEITISILFISF